VTDAQAIARFAPPQRRAAAPRVVVAAVILAVPVFFAFRRYGDTVGEFAAAGAVVILVGVMLTTMRRVSDDFYDRRARWRKLYMCRKCGQLITP
jgi:uncharacterized membrane protein YoaK (UPF0700 family)